MPLSDFDSRQKVRILERGYKKKYKDFNNTFLKWKNESQYPTTYYCPRIPNIIVGEGVIDLTRDDWIELTNDNIFLAIRTDIRFGMLASHLLAVISDRIRPRHEFFNIPYSVRGYYPFKIYDRELRDSEKLGFDMTNIKKSNEMDS